MQKTNIENSAKPSTSTFTRRQFLSRTTLAVGAAALSFPYVGRVLGANERINVACIGVGGKGDSDSSDAAACGGNIVALCDVDRNTLAGKVRQFENKFPEVKQYRDYRKMLEEMDKSIDAVTVSTPDHNHGIAAIRAMKMGKHCFCQKPLVQTVYEARTVRRLAKEKNLATQMGNQGSAESGLRRAVEVIQAGRHRQPARMPCLVQPPHLAPGSGAARGPGPGAGESGLGSVARPGPGAAFQGGRLSRLQVARVVRFRHRRPGRHGLPHREHAFPRPQAGLSQCGRTAKRPREIYPETFPKTSRIRFEFPAREGLPAAQVLVV